MPILNAVGNSPNKRDNKRGHLDWRKNCVPKDY